MMREAYMERITFPSKGEMMSFLRTRAYNDIRGSLDELFRFLENLRCIYRVRGKFAFDGSRATTVSMCIRGDIELPAVSAEQLLNLERSLAVHYGLVPSSRNRVEDAKFDPFSEMVQPDGEGLELVAALSLLPDELRQFNVILSRLSIDGDGVHVWTKSGERSPILGQLCEMGIAVDSGETRGDWCRFDFAQRPDALHIVAIDQRLLFGVSQRLHDMLSRFVASSDPFELELALLDAFVYDEAVECGLLAAHPSNSSCLPVLAPFQPYDYYAIEPVSLEVPVIEDVAPIEVAAPPTITSNRPADVDRERLALRAQLQTEVAATIADMKETTSRITDFKAEHERVRQKFTEQCILLAALIRANTEYTEYICSDFGIIVPEVRFDSQARSALEEREILLEQLHAIPLVLKSLETDLAALKLHRADLKAKLRRL